MQNVSKVSEIREQRRRLLRRNDGPEELATTTEASIEEDEPEVMTKTMRRSCSRGVHTIRLKLNDCGLSYFKITFSTDNKI